MARGGVGLIQDSRVTLNSLRRSTTTFFRHETVGLFFLWSSWIYFTTWKYTFQFSLDSFHFCSAWIIGNFPSLNHLPDGDHHKLVTGKSSQ